MVENESSSDMKKEVIAKRSLTHVEQQRIQALHTRNAGQEAMPTDFFKLKSCEDKENGFNVFIDPVLKKDLPDPELHDEHQARGLEATGFSDTQVTGHVLINIGKALCNADASIESSLTMMNRVGHYMKEFRPKDAIEGTLCAQIVVCQERALELLHKACGQKNPEWARIHHNASSKLFARAQAAIQTLISYRRGGQQKVVVEHVNVEAGGQAAFGNFQAGGGGMNGANCRGTP